MASQLTTTYHAQFADRTTQVADALGVSRQTAHERYG
jgi:hypothetical protein